MSATARSNRLPGFRTLLAAGALAASAGCAENEVSVYIRLMKAPTVQMNQCSITNDMSGSFITEGTLDLAFRQTYNLAPLIQNNIFGRFDNQANRAESNHIYIEGYIVEIREDSPTGPLFQPTGSTFNNPFSVYQSLTIPASLQGTASFGATIFEAIPPADRRGPPPGALHPSAAGWGSSPGPRRRRPTPACPATTSTSSSASS